MKTTTKRVFSLFLTLVMALGLCTVGASAHVISGTITAYASGSSTPLGTYGSITEAANAAGTNGRVELSAGTFEFDYRQIIAADGLTLEGQGIGSTFVKTSSSFASAGTSDRKALLTLTGTDADNPIVVTGITFDGSAYGATSSFTPTSSEETQFNVVRVNSGSATLENVYITGSKRTLLSVGMSNSYVEVEANGLICQGLDKTITEGNAYADVSIVNGKLTLDEDCVIDAFICLDSNNNTRELDATACDGLYTLKSPVTILFFTYYVDVTSTLKHFAHSFTTCDSNTERNMYATTENYSGNYLTLDAMVGEAIDNLEDGTVTADDLQIAEDLLSALTYGLSKYPSNQNIQDWYADLSDAYSIATSQS